MREYTNEELPEEIRKHLSMYAKPTTGKALAYKYGVSLSKIRIAVNKLRLRGVLITATNDGYVCSDDNNDKLKQLELMRRKRELLDEQINRLERSLY